MADKIVIGAELDTSKVEKKLAELEKRLKSIRELGPSGSVAQAAGGYKNIGEEERANRLEQLRQRAEAQNRQGLHRDLQQKEARLDKILTIESKINDAIKKRSEQGRDTTKYLEMQKKLTQEIYDITAQTGKMQKALGGSGEPENKFLDSMKRIGSVSSAVGTAATAIVQFQDFQNRVLPTNRAERAISLAESTYQDREKDLKGEGLRNLFFAEERDKALQTSAVFGEKQFDINQNKGTAQGAGGTALLGLAAAIALTMATGGVAAPLMLGAGTAAVGSAVGGVGMLTKDKGMGYEAMFGSRAEIDKMTGQQIVDRYKLAQKEEEVRDPIRTHLKNYVIENQNEMLQGMRKTGMSEEEFIKSHMQAGMPGADNFLKSDRQKMADTILGAGGTARGAYGQSQITALHAERGLGLSNAGEAMGRIQSFTGAMSDQAFVKILEKGVKGGFDKAEFREEFKDYLDKTTSMAAQWGGGGEFIANLMQSGMQGDDITRKGVEFSAESAQSYMQKMGSSQGLIGANKAAAISKAFTGLSGTDKLGLMNADPRDLTPDSPFLQYISEKTGMSEEEIIEKMRGIQSGAVTGGYGDWSKRFGEIKEGLLKDPKNKKLIGEATNIYRQMHNMQGAPEERVRKEMFQSLGVNQGDDTWEDIERQQRTNETMNTTPKSALEQQRENAAKMQADASRGLTKDGKDLPTLMAEMAQNTSEMLDMELSNRLNLTNFHKALEDGATEVVKAMLKVISGNESPTPIQRIQASKTKGRWVDKRNPKM